jgi:primosomal replication protein N
MPRRSLRGRHKQRRCPTTILRIATTTVSVSGPTGIRTATTVLHYSALRAEKSSDRGYFCDVPGRRGCCVRVDIAHLHGVGYVQNVVSHTATQNTRHECTAATAVMSNKVHNRKHSAGYNESTLHDNPPPTRSPCISS